MGSRVYSWGQVMKRSLSLPTAAALLLCSASFAQKPASQVTKPVKPPSTTSRGEREDGKEEQELRVRLQKEFEREHSDASGRVRPDLWNEGVAHMMRMKVISHIGPVPKESPGKK